jgi:hypothetical protein
MFLHVGKVNKYSVAEVHEREKYAFLTMAHAMCDLLAEGVISLEAILYLAQSLAPVPYGIDVDGCQCVT